MVKDRKDRRVSFCTTIPYKVDLSLNNKSVKIIKKKEFNKKNISLLSQEFSEFLGSFNFNANLDPDYVFIIIVLMKKLFKSNKFLKLFNGQLAINIQAYLITAFKCNIDIITNYFKTEEGNNALTKYNTIICKKRYALLNNL